MSKTPPNIRGHHLLCSLTYCGVGYTGAFAKNFDSVCAQINSGGAVKIVSGVDDICDALHRDSAEPCDHAKVCIGRLITFRDRIALFSVQKALQLPSIRAGEEITLGKYEVTHLRTLFVKGSLRYACMGCPWHTSCSAIADKNFADVKLLPEAVPSPSHLRQRAYAQSSLGL